MAKLPPDNGVDVVQLPVREADVVVGVDVGRKKKKERRARTEKQNETAVAHASSSPSTPSFPLNPLVSV